MAVNLPEQGGPPLLRIAGNQPPFPVVIQMVFYALLFCLLIGLSIAKRAMQVIRRQKRILGAKAKQDRFALDKPAKKHGSRYVPHLQVTTYGTSSIPDSVPINYSPTSSSWLSSNELTAITSHLSYDGSFHTGIGGPTGICKLRSDLYLGLVYVIRQVGKAMGKCATRIEAWMLYQPAKIPYLNISLPSNGTSLGIAAMYAYVLLFLVVGIPFNSNYALCMADRAGPLMSALLPPLYHFAAKNQPIQYLTGYAYEDLQIFHRRLGELMVGLGLFHSAGKFALWYTTLASEEFNLIAFCTLKVVLTGLASFLAYEFLFFTSIKAFRERYYQLFLVLHRYGQFVALVFLAVHAPMSRLWVGVAFMIFFIDRIILRTAMRAKNVIARVKIFPDGDTINLKIDKDSNGGQTCRFLQKYFWLKRSFEGDWRPTAHVFLRIPGMDAHNTESRPYFVCCAAPCERPWSSVIDLYMIVPARGPFSRKLLEYCRREIITLDIDGPYGSCFAVDMLSDRDVCILIAGGTGISGVWPLAWHLIDEDLTDDLDMSSDWHCRQEVILIWSYRYQHELEWIGGKDEISILEKYGITVLLIGPTETQPRTDLDVDIEWWMGKHDQKDNLRTGIVCCGPPEMQRKVRNKAAEEVRAGRKVAYHDLTFKP
ncbi:hypothetical protein MMC10_004547 [Thelotrema lepadinum]|nr:hypothetical protein [Thelotrema lepadinum]